MKTRYTLSLIGAMSIATAVRGQLPSVPPLLNYQGLLTDSAGNPVPSGTKKIEFNVYTNAVGGTAVWGPQVFPAAAVVNGSFNVILGPTDGTARSLADAFIRAAECYIGIRLDDGPEVTPRQRMLSTPFALVAQTAVTAVQHTPPGSVIAFAGSDTNVPAGWLLCDGGCRKHTDYPELFAAIGTAWGDGSDDGDPLTDFNLPDLRGMFLRGVSGTRADSFADPDLALRTNVVRIGQNVGNAVGSVQEDAFASHTHTYQGGGNQVNPNNAPAAGSGYPSGSFPVSSAGGNETRPANAFVHYIIKY